VGDVQNRQIHRGKKANLAKSGDVSAPHEFMSYHATQRPFLGFCAGLIESDSAATNDCAQKRGIVPDQILASRVYRWNLINENSYPR